MAFPKPVDRKIFQEQKIKKLKMQLEKTEKQMADQALLRQKLEDLVYLRSIRAHKGFDKLNTGHLVGREKVDEVYGNDQNIYSQTRNRVLDEMIALRTRDFQRSQAEKAAKIKLLTYERQQILEAHKQLREKQNKLRRLPSPVGEATDRMWGHKYSLYTPLHYDNYSHIYTPAFQDGYYTHFPHVKRKKRRFRSNILFVPTPLFQSLW